MKYILFCFVISVSFSCNPTVGEYVCPPCDLPCDKLTFEKPGICPHCDMTLIKKSDLITESNLIPNEVNLKNGSGVFLMNGINNNESKSVKVYYHKPKSFSESSKILMVIPGAGRDADEYRDAWIESAENHDVLILSPMLEEGKYPFEDYHLCGLMENLNLNEVFEFVKGTNQIKLNDEKFSFEINHDSNNWIFNLFDMIFEMVVESEKTKQTSYDMFGHSAGGQILHRMALLHRNLKVNQIVAANSGFYTLPDLEVDLPFGLNGLKLSNEELSNKFSNNLTVLVGELDNESETKGTLLRSSVVDEQGLHRLARAKYFFNYGKSKAKTMNAKFNWKLEVVPNVGHDFRLMTSAASKLLYE